MVAVDICNLALSYLGDTATVASIDPPEGSAQAQHCARFYPVALNLLLESHRWNFTTKRAYLAVVEKCTFDAWQFAYALPSDATDVISVLPKALYPVVYFRDALANDWWPLEFELSRAKDFQVEVFNGQQVILSNACDAVARYTVSTVQPGMFPALFTDALAWKLASMLAGPLLKGDAGAAESKRCLGMYQVVMEQAKGQDANQRRGSERPVPSSIRARL
jgi:hypothetical protein